MLHDLDNNKQQLAGAAFICVKVYLSQDYFWPLSPIVWINGFTVLWLVGWVPRAAVALECANRRPLKEPFMSHWELRTIHICLGEKDHFCIN